MNTPVAAVDPRPLRIALIAGEASGDLLGAGLLAALRQRFPNARFAGIGGPRMVAEGFEAWHDCEALAVMGLAEVLRHLPRLLRLRRDTVARLIAWQPDLFIGIDAPDFNLGVERRLKNAGLRTVHYVSPSIWAWRQGRAKRIGRSADRVLCLFPNEPAIYAQHGVDAVFVGHPQADAFPLEPDRAGARAALGLPPDAPVLALLPGSRLGEIRRIGPDFLGAAARVRARVPGLRIVLPTANAAGRAAVDALLAAHPDGPALREALSLHDGQAPACMTAADAILLASGTATLEALLTHRPMVVGYRISPVTLAIVRALRLLKTRLYSLPNMLAGEALVPELMQDDCKPERLSAAVLDILEHPDHHAQLEPRFRALHALLRRDASHSAAAACADLLPPA